MGQNSLTMFGTVPLYKHIINLSIETFHCISIYSRLTVLLANDLDLKQIYKKHEQCKQRQVSSYIFI